ncbi:hypothetical protein GCM10022204_00120 [Microlunatus aurantiacus]|uniref:Nudix hydrolase domain-containing protein n=1 Tax=Microlunatus aurantiacus TaxID=446786 RepID=A0ABP7CF95_9ACTN
MTETATSEPAIAAAVIVRDGRVLLIRRRLREGALLWALPSGGVEAGEAPADAARRESLEEVGLSVTPVESLGERVHPITGRRMHYFACTPDDGTPEVRDTDEIAELAWVSRSQVSELVPGGFFDKVEQYLAQALT